MSERTAAVPGAQHAGPTGHKAGHPVPDALTAAFVAQRPRLHAIASRILGSSWDADDAVQEAWIRLQHADAGRIENLRAWLTTVTSRICVDLLRRTRTRHEDLSADLPGAEQAATGELPEVEALTSDAVNLALLVVLDELPPVQRVAFVLHDVFGLPFEEIAPIVERSPAAARQLASRARRRVASIDLPGERRRRSDAVDAFLTASRDGDFGGLLQLLDPEIRLRADEEVIAGSAPFVAAGAPDLAPSLRGADAVARAFAGRAARARRALIDGVPGAVYESAGSVTAVYIIHLQDGRIVRIEVIGNTERIAGLTIAAVPE